MLDWGELRGRLIAPVAGHTCLRRGRVARVGIVAGVHWGLRLGVLRGTRDGRLQRRVRAGVLLRIGGRKVGGNGAGPLALAVGAPLADDTDVGREAAHALTRPLPLGVRSTGKRRCDAADDAIVALCDEGCVVPVQSGPEASGHRGL